MRIVLILIDALRHDWIDARRTPHMARLAAAGARRAIADTFGFIGIRGAVFYGLAPAESGYVFLWERDPERSQFRSLRLAPECFRRPTMTRALVRVANRLRRARDPLAPPIWDVSAIPPHLLPRFRFAEPRSPLNLRYLPGRDSLFSAYGPGEVLYLGYPGADQRREPLLRQLDRRLHGGVKLLFLHFSELDWAQHRFGPEAPESLRVLGEIDAAVGEALASVSRRLSEPILTCLFGDHGAVEIGEHLDLEGELALDRLSRTRQLDYFLDSTMARFWAESREEIDALRARLASHPHGRIVPPEELPALGCRYERATFGDLLFCVRPGVLIYPNFFQRREPCLGMHGYLPGTEDDLGALALSVQGGPLPELPAGPLAMTDLHRILTQAAAGQPAGTAATPAIAAALASTRP